jgi:hypothetical protein
LEKKKRQVMANLIPGLVNQPSSLGTLISATWQGEFHRSSVSMYCSVAQRHDDIAQQLEVIGGNVNRMAWLVRIPFKEDWIFFFNKMNQSFVVVESYVQLLCAMLPNRSARQQVPTIIPDGLFPGPFSSDILNPRIFRLQ